MPIWLPILKASLPYVTQIVATALPAFTSKPPEGKTDNKADDIKTQQIAELQSAVTQNAESIHVLAEKLQQTIEGIEMASNELEKKLLLFKQLAYWSIGIAAVSLATAIASLLF